MRNNTKNIDEKQVIMDIILEDLEYLGDYLSVQQMAQNIKIYNEEDILNLIKEGTLPVRKISGKRKVKLENFVEHYAEVFDEIPENGVDKDWYFYNGDELM